MDAKMNKLLAALSEMPKGCHVTIQVEATEDGTDDILTACVFKDDVVIAGISVDQYEPEFFKLLTNLIERHGK